jgi:hypothetical protein
MFWQARVDSKKIIGKGTYQRNWSTACPKGCGQQQSKQVHAYWSHGGDVEAFSSDQLRSR